MTTQELREFLGALSENPFAANAASGFRQPCGGNWAAPPSRDVNSVAEAKIESLARACGGFQNLCTLLGAVQGGVVEVSIPEEIPPHP